MPRPDFTGRCRVLASLLTATAVISTLAAFTNIARALPLFGRKYNMQCTSCHIAAPRLNAFGMHFKQNGYRMPGAQGESPWDSTAKEFPLALVGNVAYHVSSVNADTGGGNRVRTFAGAFEQQQVEFHSAGTLAKRVTFHFDNNFAGAGGPLESGMAFVQYDDVMKDGGLNVKAGIFDADIPYLADSRKTTLTEYLSPVTLPAAGVELNGERPDWMYAVGLINSSRDSASVNARKPGTKTFNQLENPYVWVTREIGANMVTARAYLDQQNPRKAGVTSSQHVQAELNAFFDRGRVVVVPGYTYESFADEPDSIPDHQHTLLIEALWLLDKDSRLVLTTRYEHQYVPRSNGAPGVIDRSLGVLSLAYYVNPNARYGIDWAHGSDNVHGPVTDDVRAFVWVGY
jgi:hypothetical protein